MRSAIVPGVSTNYYAYSIHGQLTNEVQNGVSIARTYDSLNRPTGCNNIEKKGNAERNNVFEIGMQGFI